jgi:hypothetical protein
MVGTRRPKFDFSLEQIMELGLKKSLASETGVPGETGCWGIGLNPSPSELRRKRGIREVRNVR